MSCFEYLTFVDGIVICADTSARPMELALSEQVSGYVRSHYDHIECFRIPYAAIPNDRTHLTSYCFRLCTDSLLIP
jgi:hypothetical protein